MKTVWCIWCMIIAMATGVQAQTAVEDIVIGERVTMSSAMYGETRDLLVHLPKSYHETNGTYPVLYRLDGEFTFLDTVGACEALVYDEETVPEVILVCIENVDRGRDMLYPSSQFAPPNTSNEKFLTFIENELIPLIDSRYRTSGYRMLCGQSTSGMFSMFAFIEAQHLFQAYLVLSPSVADCVQDMVKTISDAHMQNLEPTTKLYLAWGGDERETDIGKNALQFMDILFEREENEAVVNWKYNVFEHEGHVPSSGLHDGIRWIFQ